MAAGLDLVVAGGGGVHPPTGLDDGLIQPRALGAGEEPVLADELERAVAHPHLGDPGHRRIGGEEDLELALQRDREGVDDDRGAVLAGERDDRGEPHRGAAQPGPGAGDAHRPPHRLLRLPCVDAVDPGEAPAPVDDHPHPDALVVGEGHPGHPAVLDLEGLDGAHHHPAVGVRRPRRHRLVEGTLGDIPHGRDATQPPSPPPARRAPAPRSPVPRWAGRAGSPGRRRSRAGGARRAAPRSRRPRR